MKINSSQKFARALARLGGTIQAGTAIDYLHSEMLAQESIDQNGSYLKPAIRPAGITFLDLLNLTPIMVARKKAVTETNTMK